MGIHTVAHSGHAR